MAIVKMNQFQLFSFDYDRERLLKELQKFEYVHFTAYDINPDESDTLHRVDVSDRLTALQEELTKARWAISLLEQYKDKPSAIQQLKEGKKTLSLSEIYRRASEFAFEREHSDLYNIQTEMTNLKQDIQSLESQIEELYPWRSIDTPIGHLKSLHRVKFFTGTIPEKLFSELKNDIQAMDHVYLEKIQYHNKMYYVLGISSEEESSDFLEKLRTNGFTSQEIKTSDTVKNAIVALRDKIEGKKQEIKEREVKLKDKASLLEDFQIYEDYLKNTLIKESASEKFAKTEKVDIIDGYVPTSMSEDFQKHLKEALGEHYFLDMKPADRDDPNVPIILKNNKFVQPFESLTQMYALPRYNEVDPTPLFAPFYAFFAGMMVGDLGYGLILLLATLIVPRIFNLDKAKKNFLKFFMYLAVSTCFWGLIYGSFFGGVVTLPALIDTNKDYVPMMLLAIAIGGIHLFFSMGIKAYMSIRDKKPLDAFFDVGLWYMILISLILILINGMKPGALPPVVIKIAKICAIAAAIGIVLTGGREAESIGGKLGGGIYSLYGISSWLGDFVSYLRLMALGLSGAFIAVAVNMISGMMLKSNIVIGLIGIIVFVVFQAFNMFLSYLSAYVHSARLVYVEMFNKFYEGGGKPFHKLVEESNYFNLINK